MITEWNKADFHKCRKLLHEQSHLEAMAVVEKINPGRIFVDDVDHPVSGVIWLGNNDGFIFFGSEQNEGFNHPLNQFIDHVIIPEAKKVGLKEFEAIGNHQKWNETIERIFAHRKLGSWNQRVYSLPQDSDITSNKPTIEQGYQMVSITEKLLKNTDNAVTNIEFLQAKITEFWSSTEGFLRNGMGYGMVYQRELVSVCFSRFVAGNIHCIDIETLEAHQGKKLAQVLAHCFVEECLENNKLSYWDCMEMNKASVAVAEHIGLRNVWNYVGYDFSLEST
ncbi:GNAT family N-acetyltransferase [Gracilibacillus phocaeensis]|uniref:GNAT family N-acetyltransferase n=1 Tax=Gracilibacillus phocaeensis TaxID=2042304 RepID=UPI001031E80A|nr:GNAT family N-acetyltransferase [Gracilibacillus phocaeensis]